MVPSCVSLPWAQVVVPLGEVAAVQSLTQVPVASALLVHLLVLEELLVVPLVVAVAVLVVSPLPSGLSASAQLVAAYSPRLRRMAFQALARRAPPTIVQTRSNPKVAREGVCVDSRVHHDGFGVRERSGRNGRPCTMIANRA